jgi:hypothetical protein
VLSASLHASSLLEIKQGANTLDLNGDGRSDLVVLAHYDNNKSHPSQSISFYVNKPEGGYSIMPSIDEKQFSYFDLALSGSNVKVSGFALFQHHNKVFFVTSDKQTISAYDPDEFTFTLYELSESDDHPGIPLYQWIKVSSASSTAQYLSAEESFTELTSQFFKP